MKKINNLLGFILICTIFVVGYQYASQSGRFSSYVLPPISKIGYSFQSLVKSGTLFLHIFVSLKRIVHGFIVSFAIAFTFSMIDYFFPKLKMLYQYLFDFFRNVPPLSLIPLLILWFGIGETTKLIIIILASFFPMYMNISSGFLTCDKQLLEVGKIYHLNNIQQFYRIVLPNARREILVGLRIGMGYCFRAIIGAEMIAASSGLGYLILDSQQMSRVDRVFVGIIVIGCLGVIMDYILKRVILRFEKGAYFE